MFYTYTCSTYPIEMDNSYPNKVMELYPILSTSLISLNMGATQKSYLGIYLIKFQEFLNILILIIPLIFLCIFFFSISPLIFFIVSLSNITPTPDRPILFFIFHKVLSLTFYHQILLYKIVLDK